jgi:DNA-binding MarR family transcriptional regulator
VPGQRRSPAEALGITPSSATSACKRLEQAGLVTRTRQATDKRVVLVDLTAQGRAQLVELRRRQRKAMGRLLAVLDPQEQATLQRLLARVLAAGRQGAGGPSCCTSALRQKEPSTVS